jgi:hypothetical protein
MITPSNPPKLRHLLYFQTVVWRMRFWLATTNRCTDIKWKRGGDYALAQTERMLVIHQRWRQILTFR